MPYAATLAHFDARELVLAEAVAGARFLCEAYLVEAGEAFAAWGFLQDTDADLLDRARAGVRLLEADRLLTDGHDLLLKALETLRAVRDERAAFVRAHLPGEVAA